MSDERNEHPEAERSDAPPEPVSTEEATPSTPPPPEAEPPLAEPAGPWSPTERERAALAAYGRRSRSWTALLLAALLIVVAAGVLSSPFWAAAVAPLLPWGEQSSVVRYDALAQRMAALEARPVAPAIDADAIKSAQAALAQKLTALKDRVATLGQAQKAREAQEAATKAALGQQSQRLDAAEARLAARAAAQAAEIDKMRQELAQHGAAGGELTTRLDALEHQVHAQSNIDRSEGIRLLALLQMREAVEAGQPFPAEYAAFSQLAAGEPKLAAAAGPLADAARKGVASPAELRRRLAAVADQIADANAPAAKSSGAKSRWWEQALDRLRALVTVRRVDGSAKTGPEAQVNAAQTALAQGDLAGAVAALNGLSGADGEAAQPWLKLARQRLAAEATLTHLQGLLTAQLAAPPASPAATAPAPATAAPAAAPPAAPKTPS